MIKPSRLNISFILLLLSICDLLSAQTSFRHINWEKEKIAPGLTWKYSHARFDDSVMQNINILIVRLTKRELSIHYNPRKNMPVSSQAEEVKAIAAVNGGFFNILSNGSTTYIRTAGVILDPDTVSKWTKNWNMTGALLITQTGKVFIESAKLNAWYDMHVEFPDVLVSGPLLLSDRKSQELSDTPLVTNKHPRTAIGKRGRNKIIIVTVDGRTPQSSGLTLSELTHLMKSFHCKDALNLDGGGSTTMWISGKPFNGIVNMPSDNKKFDHEGERAVSDIIVIK
jgi:exopolysaccharide biosynthesis protein